MRKLAAVTSTMLAALFAGSAACATDAPVKIGVISDQSGIYSYLSGRGIIEAARLAVEDAGGKVLGRNIQILTGDDQNKPDVGGAIARKWIEKDNVDVLLSGTGSATTLSVLNVAKEHDKTILISGAGLSDITGKFCTKNATHWSYDTYGAASGVAKAVIAQGGKSWFFVAADYSFGQALTRDTTRFVEAAGGKVIGTVRHPIGSKDFASFLLAARGSGAEIIGLANAGEDTVTAVKQAHEFGLSQGGQRLAGLLLFVNDIQAIGIASAQQTLGAASFYHDQSDAAKAWSKRYMERFPGNNLPNMNHAAAYAAVRHYLKSAEAVGTLDMAKVGAEMRKQPVNDFYNKDVVIRRDGRVLHDMMLWRTKTPTESSGPSDILQILQTLPGAEVFRPESDGGCPLVN